MTEIDIAPSFGAELKDGFKPVNAWVSNGISWLDDIQQFYRERSVVEKEYSSKLAALAKRYYEKKAKRSGSLSVGDTPTLTPGSLESASLTTWTTQLSTLERRAAEHDRYSAELVMQVSEPLKNIATRYEELRKSHVEFAAKLERERDAAYTALKRTKGQYDGSCQEVESRRKKIESSFDMSKQKAQNAYQQQILDMHNVKNTYLISINVTNKQKQKYYHEYVPDLIDSLQDLAETRTSQLNSIWSHAAKLENETLSRSVDHMKYLSSEIPRNDPRLDSIMFVRHNAAAWQEPGDMVFEPSPVWHDDSSMAVDETSKIFLRNILGKSKGQISELRKEEDAKRKELARAREIRKLVREGRDKRDELEVVRGTFIVQGDLQDIERKRITAEVETSTITSVVGDISLGAQNHNFKSQTFKIPTNCDLCGERIWGLSAKGFDCRDCGYTCHSKCELKVPANCPGEQSKDERKKLKVERQASANTSPQPQTNGGPPDGVTELPALSRSNTMNSLSSGYAASAHRSVSGVGARAPTEDTRQEPKIVSSKPTNTRKNRVVAPPPTQYVSELPANGLNGGSSTPPSRSAEPRGKMMYPYQASGEGEISVDEGEEVVIIEPDDGSGWMTIRFSGTSGIVPSSYLEILPPTPTFSDRPSSAYSNSSASLSSSIQAASTAKKKGPAVAPKRGAKKLKYAEALYAYEARTEAEWSMVEGERFVLINKDSGDGWADVEKGGQVKSVPANYIQEV
ncbi:hypothetical protein MMC17_009309 [Xylographa soralifera]|nr:hypothetical protein [Xylographa soralifera]